MASERTLCAFGLVILLTGCGVDGPPEPPERDRSPSAGASITLSGESSVGVVGGS